MHFIPFFITGHPDNRIMRIPENKIRIYSGDNTNGPLKFEKGKRKSLKEKSSKIMEVNNMKTMKRFLAILIVAVTVFSTSICAFAAGGTFTIVFNANGGSGTMANQQITYGTTTQVNINLFKRSGYVFRGWNVQRADGTWNTEKLYGGDEGWRKTIPSGYHKTLYKDAEKVAKTAPAGQKVTFYAVWEGANDKFSTFNRTTIQETSKSFSSSTNPMYKSDNQFWIIKSKASYPGFGTTNTGVFSGALAMAIIDNMLYGKYDKTFKKYQNGDSTNFSSVGYIYSPDYTSYEAFIQAIYDQIVRGFPVPIKVKDPTGHAIYAVAYGIMSNKGRPSGKIIAHDIAVIDTYSGSWRRLDEMCKYTPSGKYEMGIAGWDLTNLYTLDEETYNFANYSDSDSYGHCFGMAVTTSGYYHHFLDLKDVSSTAKFVHNLPNDSKVKNTICNYQNIQGSFSAKSIVAGYNYNKFDNMKDAWTDIVNYVKSGAYNYKGRFMVTLFDKTKGGHAVNFLAYKRENGQDRIYVYDNNFPNKSVYLYLGSDNKIYETPKSTFGTGIDKSISLLDTFIYFSLAKGYDPTRVIYAPKDAISVEGAEAYPMCMGSGNEEYVMYEIPEESSNVKINILNKNNWKFEHNGETYSKEDCSGNSRFILSFTAHDGTEYKGHFEKPNGTFGWLNAIFYKLFGWMSF